MERASSASGPVVRRPRWTGSFDHAGEPRATTDAVVFTAWQGPKADSDTDVWLYDVQGPQLVVALQGAGQQRFADVSPTHVAVSDFSEDPDGIYDGDGTSLADIVVIERSTFKKAARSAKGQASFSAFGLVRGAALPRLDRSAPRAQAARLQESTPCRSAI